MGNTTVRDIMSEGVIGCNPDTPLSEVAKIIALAEVNAILILDVGGELRGLIGQVDLLKFYGKDLKLLLAKEIMTPSESLIKISAEAPIEEAIKLLLEFRVHRLIVPNKENPNKPDGVISATDIVRSMIEPIFRIDN